jgi:uncharacterized membrane protein YraQ (UPF0718 family)
MKIALGLMIFLAIFLGGLTFSRGGFNLFKQGLQSGLVGSMKLVPLILFVSLLTGFVEVLIPKETFGAWLSESSGWKGFGLAWVAGVLTPGGGPIGLPLAATLMRAGASVGVLVTYLTSMSLLSFIRIPMELGIYGVRLTIMRLVTSALLPLIAGLVAQFLSNI